MHAKVIDRSPSSRDMSLTKAPGVALLRHASPRSKPFRVTRFAAQASASQSEENVDRRKILLGCAAAASVSAFPLPGAAEGEIGETKVMYGLASPPTSYGGYGGNAKEAAKYTYSYPTGWKQETVGKQEKGMVGIDSRVRNPRVKLETAFTVTFGRSGEDNKKFKLGNVESTLQGFAGADYQLQDAIVSSTNQKSNKRVKDEQEFYDYEVFSPDVNFLVSVSLKQGKVFALFVKAPAKVFKTDEASLRGIIESFTIL